MRIGSAVQADRAPVLENCPPGVSAAFRLRPGGSAAHGEDRLRLLPSGPDLVHGTSSRGTWPSTPYRGVLTLRAEPSDGDSAPLERVAGYRAPLAPHLARSAAHFRGVTRPLGTRHSNARRSRPVFRGCSGLLGLFDRPRGRGLERVAPETRDERAHREVVPD